MTRSALFATTAFLLLSACATSPKATDPDAPNLTGRAVSVKQTDAFYGDVQFIADIYQIEPVGSSGSLVAVVGRDDCPAVDGKIYDIWLAREKLGFIQGTDPAYMTNLTVVRCQPAGESSGERK